MTVNFQFILGPSCPSGYSIMGQVSDGRTCFGSPPTVTLVGSSTSTCPVPTMDLLRSRWIPTTPYADDWFRRSVGYEKDALLIVG